MKPFNLEEAKAGKPVVTRDGRPVRILAFDRKGNMPIIGLVTNREVEIGCYFSVDGKASNFFEENDIDLFMKAEKKEGWVNLYRDNRGVVFPSVVTSAEDYSKSQISPVTDYITTIKVEWEE